MNNNKSTTIKIELDKDNNISNYDEIINFIYNCDPRENHDEIKALLIDINNKLSNNEINFADDTPANSDLKKLRDIITNYQLRQFDLKNDNLEEQNLNQGKEQTHSKVLVLSSRKDSHHRSLFANSDAGNNNGLFIPSVLLMMAVTVTSIMYIILAIVHVLG